MSEPSIIDWIGALANVGTFIVILCGLFTARKQLHVWRSEARARRKSEAAIDLIVAAVNVSDALKGIRAGVGHIPAEKVKGIVYQRRYDRVVDSDGLFEGLRQTQIVANAVIGNGMADDVNELFNIRGEVEEAIEGLLHVVKYTDIPEGNYASPSEKKFIIEMGQTLFGSYDDKDKVWARQLNAISSIEEKLGSVARFEGR